MQVQLAYIHTVHDLLAGMRTAWFDEDSALQFASAAQLKVGQVLAGFDPIVAVRNASVPARNLSFVLFSQTAELGRNRLVRSRASCFKSGRKSTYIKLILRAQT